MAEMAFARLPVPLRSRSRVIAGDDLRTVYDEPMIDEIRVAEGALPGFLYEDWTVRTLSPRPSEETGHQVCHTEPGVGIARSVTGIDHQHVTRDHHH
jgi:hypothetical protein